MQTCRSSMGSLCYWCIEVFATVASTCADARAVSSASAGAGGTRKQRVSNEVRRDALLRRKDWCAGVERPGRLRWAPGRAGERQLGTEQETLVSPAVPSTQPNLAALLTGTSARESGRRAPVRRGPAERQVPGDTRRCAGAVLGRSCRAATPAGRRRRGERVMRPTLAPSHA